MDPSPRTVVFVLNWLPVGGVETIVIQLLSRLDRAAFQPHIVLLRERGAFADRAEALGIPVHLSPLRARLSPFGIRRLARLFRDLRADIVHSHMYRSNTTATIAARLARVPVILSQVHNVDTWETPRQRWMDRFLMRWRSGVIAVSETVKRDVVRQLGVSPDFVRVLYNGIDPAPFSKSLENRDEERRREGLRPDAVVAVHAARLVEQKNHRGMLEALSRMAPRRPQLQVLVVGDGPLRTPLEAEARRLGLQDRVVFAGRRNDVPRLFALADFSVLPSFKEGFSLVVVESMAAGLPLVVTDVGGNTEAVRDGLEGFVVKDPTDPEGLAKALERLTGDAELRRAMGARARERARAFTLDEMARQIQQLYYELLEKAPTRRK